MSLTQTLAPHLPYLRRYARALTGSQTSGDTHVRAALSALVEGKQTLVEGVSPRVGLYRLFHATWSTTVEADDDRKTPPPTPEARLHALDSHKRSALLLTAVETFSIEETAFILATADRFLATIPPERYNFDLAKATVMQVDNL